MERADPPIKPLQQYGNQNTIIFNKNIRKFSKIAPSLHENMATLFCGKICHMFVISEHIWHLLFKLWRNLVNELLANQDQIVF